MDIPHSQRFTEKKVLLASIILGCDEYHYLNLI